MLIKRMLSTNNLDAIRLLIPLVFVLQERWPNQGITYHNNFIS